MANFLVEQGRVKKAKTISEMFDPQYLKRAAPEMVR